MSRPTQLLAASLSALFTSLLIVLVVVASAGAVAACGGDPDKKLPSEDGVAAGAAWPMWGFNPARTRVGPDVGLPDGRTPTDALWSKSEMVEQFGDLLEYPPSIADGRAFYCTNGGGKGGSVIAVSLADGKELWRYRLSGGGQFASQPAVVGGIVYVGTMRPHEGRGDPDYEPELLALRAASDDPGGSVVWRRVIGHAIESSPLVVGDRLYLCSQNGTLYCYDRLAGARRWARPLGGKTTSSPAYRDGRVIVATYGGAVYAFDAASGVRLWRSALRGMFYGTPAIYGRRVIVASLSNGRIYSLDARNGHTQWVFPTSQGVYASPAVWHDAVYIGTKYAGFWCLDVRTGKPKWPKRKYAGPVYGSATILGGTVYFSTFAAPGKKTGITYGLDARTGMVRWAFPDGCYSPVTATSSIILVTGHHTVYAFRPTP